MRVPDRDTLSRAYARTVYRVFLTGGSVMDLRVGRRCLQLDRMLASGARRHWAFVTASNPGSRPLPAWRNAQRTRRLAATLRRRYAVLPGLGIPEDSGWQPEVSLLVLGLAPGAALRIARQFGQNAIVAGRRGGPSELLWCQTSRPRLIA